MLEALQRPLVAPLTTRIRGLATEFVLDSDDGLPQRCVASLDNVQPLARSLLVERIGRLAEERMVAVCDALAVAVECER